MSLYPLKFKPRLVEKIWGGRKIETVLGKPLPPGKQIGESWELYDFPPGVCDPSGKCVAVNNAGSVIGTAAERPAAGLGENWRATGSTKDHDGDRRTSARGGG